MGHRAGVLTIPAGTAVSPSRSANNISLLAIQAPADLESVTYEVEVSVNGTGFMAHPNGAMDAANEIVHFDVFPFAEFRIKASGNVTTNREFAISVD